MTGELTTVLTVVATLVVSYYGCAILIMIVLEIAAQLTGARSRMLRRHLTLLLGEGLAKRILANPLIEKFDEEELERLRQSSIGSRFRRRRAPVPISYIEPRDFALAVLEEALTSEEVKDRTRIRELKDRDGMPKHTRRLLETLLQGTNGNSAHIQERLESWFRKDQEQLTAKYGGTARGWGFLLGTGLAALVGLDTIAIALRNVDTTKFCCVLKSLPQFTSCWSALPGELISGVLIAQGASFWFDVLGKITNLRSVGTRPR